MNEKLSVCGTCGFEGPNDGPAHAYMTFSPGCWARYGEILAREFSDQAYYESHRLLTDACCGQHSIDGGDPRARQSLHIHIAGLMLWFEDGASKSTIVNFLRNAACIKKFTALDVPEKNGLISISIFMKQATRIATLWRLKNMQEACLRLGKSTIRYFGS